MKRENQFIIMYDITDGRTLQKVAKEMEKHGFERINYSVWLGLTNPARDPDLKNRICDLLKKPAAKDSRVYFIPIPYRSLAAMRSIDGKKPKDLDYWLMERKTMFF
ncbi:MAG: CRISPR-associated endonuclease Cas2 [Bacteroidetes bacterium]|nr:CRISPR-associated endonuclease Cas2 [Bacteroidota bacterium]